MNEPTKFAFCGDWHGNTAWATSTIDTLGQRGVSHILHLGDYGYTFSEDFVDSVEAACARQNVALMFVDGNHDLHEFLWQLPLDEDGFGILSDHVRYIPRGQRWNWWGLTFMGLGGATSVDKQWRNPYTEWWPTEKITISDVYRAVEGGRVDVMIAHDAPSGVPIPGISFREGLQYFPHEALQEAELHRRVMRGVVDSVKPKLFVHGHYHRHYGHTEGSTRYVGLDMDTTSLHSNVWVVADRADMGFPDLQ